MSLRLPKPSFMVYIESSKEKGALFSFIDRGGHEGSTVFYFVKFSQKWPWFTKAHALASQGVICCAFVHTYSSKHTLFAINPILLREAKTCKKINFFWGFQ